MRLVLIFLLRYYQRTVSPDTGILHHWYPYGCCRYRPTCSQYAIDALARHGSIRGTILAVRRIIRCHPWSVGGYDPTPHP